MAKTDTDATVLIQLSVQKADISAFIRDWDDLATALTQVAGIDAAKLTLPAETTTIDLQEG